MLDMRLCRPLVSLMKFEDGIDGSIVHVRACLGDFSHIAFQCALDLILCTAFRAAALQSSWPVHRYHGSSHLGLFCCLPLAAFFASWSASSLPWTPLCPGIYCSVRLKSPSFRRCFARYLVIVSRRPARKSLPSLLVVVPHLMAAWLSRRIEIGYTMSGSVAISWAANVSPSVSASYTVCSSSVPRWYCSIRGSCPSRIMTAAALIPPSSPEPLVNI